MRSCASRAANYVAKSRDGDCNNSTATKRIWRVTFPTSGHTTKSMCYLTTSFSGGHSACFKLSKSSRST